MDNQSVESNEERTFLIPEGNIGRLRDLWARMEKRANKLAVQAPVLTVNPMIVEKREQDEWTGVVRIRRYYSVQIHGEAPKLAGWTFVATIQHAGDAGNILRTLPGETLPLEYRSGEQRCDHCQVNRKRIDTYVVRNEQGEHKQIGSTCVQDFCGGLSPDQAIALASYFASAFGYCEDAEKNDRGSRVPERYDLMDVLTTAATMIRMEGWCSVAKAKASYESLTATSSYVHEYLGGWYRPSEEQRKWLREHQPTEQDIQTANQAHEWAMALTEQNDEELNDYLHNVRVLVLVGSVESRGVGLATSIVAVAQREMNQRLEAQHVTQVSNHFGQVNKRDEYTLTVLSTRTFEGNYGLKTVVKFIDQSGNRAVWFASGESTLESGQTVQVKATVKDHSEFKGVKETVLSRVKVESIVEPVTQVEPMHCGK